MKEYEMTADMTEHIQHWEMMLAHKHVEMVSKGENLSLLTIDKNWRPELLTVKCRRRKEDCSVH